MSAHISDTLAERVRATAKRLPTLPRDVVEILRGVLGGRPATEDGDAA